ncbi:MAG: class I SAM-dependent methyltransferase [Bacteroidota bacterium]
MDRITREIEHGKKISKDAECIWGWKSPAGQIRAERRANYLINLGRFNSADKILEIGCGTGLFTEKVYKATHATITAIDISEDLLAQAKNKLPYVEFKVDDAMNTKFEDNDFDGVYGSSILHHLEIGKALLEILRILKPGGRMIFAEPNMLNPQIFFERNVPLIKNWFGVSPDETAIIRWNLKKLLIKTGFTECTVFPYDFLHPFTPNCLINTIKKTGEICEKIPVLKEIAGSVIIYAQKPVN